MKADTIKQVEIIGKFQKEYVRRTGKLLKIKLYSRNLIKGINTQAVPLERYSGSFGSGPKKSFSKWSRKLMTAHRTLTPRDDVDRLYVSRKEGGRGLGSIDDSVNESLQRLEDYIEKHKGALFTHIRNDTCNTMDNRMTIPRKQKLEEKQLDGRFKRLINNISHEKTWACPRKKKIKRETESLPIAAKINAIGTNHIKMTR